MESPTSPVVLSPEPARKLTDREICKILSGITGALVQASDAETVYRSFRWLMETPQFWSAMEQQQEAIEKMQQQLLQHMYIGPEPSGEPS